MDKRQLAVEWLMEQITYDNGYGQRWISFTEDTDLNIYFEDAKAMEKEQIIDAYHQGENLWSRFECKTAEVYLNETYGE